MAMKDQINDKHDEPILSKRDYINIHSHPNLIKILRKQGSYLPFSFNILILISHYSYYYYYFITQFVLELFHQKLNSVRVLPNISIHFILLWL